MSRKLGWPRLERRSFLLLLKRRRRKTLFLQQNKQNALFHSAGLLANMPCADLVLAEFYNFCSVLSFLRVFPFSSLCSFISLSALFYSVILKNLVPGNLIRVPSRSSKVDQQVKLIRIYLVLSFQILSKFGGRQPQFICCSFWYCCSLVFLAVC